MREGRWRTFSASCQNTKGSGFYPLPFDDTDSEPGLLDFSLEIRGSAVGHIDLKFDLLCLAGERMPGHDFVLAGRHILDFERTIILRHRVMRVGHREEEPLHEFMLVALQPIVPFFFRTA